VYDDVPAEILSWTQKPLLPPGLRIYTIVKVLVEEYLPKV
jgi:hypothetical protein